MTVVLAAPTTVASPTGPATSVTQPRHRQTTANDGSQPGQLSDAHNSVLAAVEEPRHRRVDRPVNHPEPAERRGAAAARSRVQHRPMDAWPLRRTDPVSVDSYRLLSRLGSGGMADVYLAVAPTGRPVAVKVLRAGAGAAEACRREYRLSSAMHAECTAPALAFGRSAAGAYLVTAYLPGYRSATTLAGEPIPTRQLWRFGSALARALTSVHARGVVHCDVKPSNLLVRNDDVRIIDFGIARYVGEQGGGGIVECSRGWAAPEQLWTTAATPAVDVFAWGCLLAQLASGVHPYASSSEQEWILRLQSAQPDLLGLPPGLNDLIRAALAHNPRDRPTARELAAICRDRDDEHMPPVRPSRGGRAASCPPIYNSATLAATLRLTSASGLPCATAIRPMRVGLGSR